MNVEKVDVKVFYAKCPICGKKIFGTPVEDVKRRLIDHMNEKHGIL